MVLDGEQSLMQAIAKNLEQERPLEEEVRAAERTKLALEEQLRVAEIRVGGSIGTEQVGEGGKRISDAMPDEMRRQSATRGSDKFPMVYGSRRTMSQLQTLLQATVPTNTTEEQKAFFVDRAQKVKNSPVVESRETRSG